MYLSCITHKEFEIELHKLWNVVFPRSLNAISFKFCGDFHFHHFNTPSVGMDEISQCWRSPNNLWHCVHHGWELKTTWCCQFGTSKHAHYIDMWKISSKRYFYSKPHSSRHPFLPMNMLATFSPSLPPPTNPSYFYCNLPLMSTWMVESFGSINYGWGHQFMCWKMAWGSKMHYRNSRNRPLFKLRYFWRDFILRI